MKYTYVLIVLFLLSTVSSSALEPVRYLTKGYVKDVMFSPDGRYIMVATTNGLDLIDPVSLRWVASPIEGVKVSALDVSSSGILLTKIGGDLVCWRMKGEKLEKLASIHPGHRISSFAISHDGRLIAIPKGDELWIWSVEEGKALKKLEDIRGTIIREVSRAESVGTGTHTYTFKAKDDTNDVTFTPDDRYLVVASYRREVELWDLTTGKIVMRFAKKGLYDWQHRLAVSDDGRMLAAMSKVDRQVNIWDLKTGRLIDSLRCYKGTGMYRISRDRSIAFTHDGRLLTILEDRQNSIAIWSPDGRISFIPSPDFLEADQIAVSPDNDKVLLLFMGDISVWSLREGKLIGRIEDYSLGEHNLIRNGRYLISSYNRLIIRDVETGRVIRRIHLMGDPPYSVVISPDGRYAYAILGDRMKKVDLEKGVVSELKTGMLHYIPPFPPPISPGGNEIIMFGWRSFTPLRICRLGGVKRYRAIRGTFDWIRCGGFSEDGRYFVLIAKDKRLRGIGIEVFKRSGVGSYRRVNRLPSHEHGKGVVNFVAIRYGLMAIATYPVAEGKITLWRFPQLRLIERIPGGGPVRFSPDGAHLFFISRDGELVIWSLRDRKAVASVPSCLSFDLSVDGQTISIVDEKGRISIWRTGDLIDPAPTPHVQGKTAELLQNFPNPFNAETWIPFRLRERRHVIIEIYDLNGYLIRRLDVGVKGPGDYTGRSSAIYWDGRNMHGESVSSGIYLYRMLSPETGFRKMTVLK